MKRYALALFMALSSMAQAAVEEGRKGPVVWHHDWSNYAVYFTNRVLYRSATLVSSSNSDASLSFNYTTNDNCKDGFLQMQFGIGTISENEVSIRDKAKFEVMSGDKSWGVRDFNYSLTTSAGSTQAVLSMDSFNWNGDTFYVALENGTKLKMSFVIDSKPHLIEFSLYGFKEAAHASEALCKVGTVFK